MDNVTEFVLFIVTRLYICVWFYLSVGFEEENKYAKGITSAIECANVAAFTFFLRDRQDLVSFASLYRQETLKFSECFFVFLAE